MGRLSLQYGTYLITVWDVSLFSMGHLSIQYGASLITVSESLITLRDVYPYSNFFVCDISHYSMGHLFMQYGTYLYIRPVIYPTQKSS